MEQKMRIGRAILAVLGLAGLAACGGGGDSGPNTVFTYQTIESTVPGESDLRAAGFTRDGDGNITGTDDPAGTLDRETDAITIAGLIVDADGREGDTWTDGSTIVSGADTAIFDGNYDFVIPVIVEEGGFATDYLIGVPSRFEDIPGGSAIYTGQSQVTGILGGGGSGASAFDSSGDLTLTADFGNSLVDVVMDGLSGADVPFDTVTLDDLEITNGGGDAVFNQTNASDFAFTAGGSAVAPVGGSETLDATGSFYGGDDQGPSEAGGTFVIQGDDGVVFGIFVADNRD